MVKIKFEFKVYIYKNVKELQVGAETPSEADREVKRMDFTEYARKEIERTASDKSFNTSRNYQTAVRSLQRFMKSDSILFKQISCDTIESYQKWLRSQDISLNTISCYMRSLRAIYNKAAGERIVPSGEEPFKKVFTGNTTTDKRSISEKDIRKIQALPVKAGSYAEMVRDIFLFCFYAMGMPFVDAVFLKKTQVEGNTITYYRHKTGQCIRIRVEPCMRRIMNKYMMPDSPYLFPIVTQQEPGAAYRQYITALGKYNRTLKRLALSAGIKSKVTSYCARHTWASVAYSSNVELPVISKALGHTNTNTTLLYIREINDNRLVAANRRILRELAF